MGTVGKMPIDVSHQPAIQNLLYQLLETELGGVKVYATALRCTKNDDLTKEWQKYLEETKHHVQVATQLVKDAGLDPHEDNPARQVVRMHGETLVSMMESALKKDPDSAELVACECVVTAETKDHLNWTLLGHVAKHVKGDLGKILFEAHEEVEDEEDHHYYHTRGWCRELWLKSLGVPSVVPPPEERKKVETAIEAARAEANRGPSARMNKD